MSEKIFSQCLNHETYEDYVDCDCNFASSHECWQYQQKKIDQLKAQIQKMRSWKNCTHEVDSDGCEQAGNLDGSCPCDKWEMMK